MVAVATDRLRDRQSAFLTIDPSTGRLARPLGRSFQTFGRRITTFASLGACPTTAGAEGQRPDPGRVSASALLRRRVPLRVRSSEAGQITVSLRVAGRSAGFGFATRDTPGDFTPHELPGLRPRPPRVRDAVGGRVQIVVGISDFKDNHRRVVRTVRLIR